MRSILACALTATLAFAACEAPTRAEPGPSLTILQGDGLEDTVRAAVTTLLLVSVRDSSGRPSRGRWVRFEAPVPPQARRSTERSVYLCSRSLPYCGVE